MPGFRALHDRLLRSLGLAARYVSGYLRSGGIGSEASHAGFRSSAPVSAGWT